VGAALTAAIESGVRLGADEGLRLFTDADLLRLGRSARARKIALSGEQVFLNINAHINPTNVCRAKCAFCGFARRADHPEAWLLTPDEVVARAAAAHEQGVREFHLVGGLHPRLPIAHWLESLRLLHETLPDASIKAFTAVEVDFYAERDGRSIEAMLDDLVDVGVTSITGGGAEIFEPSVRRRLASHKIGWERWSRVHRTAHAMGMRTSATMLYGHIEEPADRVDHLLRLRGLQDETGGFDVFVPLRFQPAGRLAHLSGPTAAEALRVFAAARLLLDNFPHIKVFSMMHGLPLSQLALQFGADDLEGTAPEYQITPDPTGETTRDELAAKFAALVREVGWEPVERDTAYAARAASGAC